MSRLPIELLKRIPRRPIKRSPDIIIVYCDQCGQKILTNVEAKIKCIECGYKLK